MRKINVKICAVVVTYNRKELLINCLEAIKQQSYKPHTVIIVDNASTDETEDIVRAKGFYESIVDGIRFQYLLLPNNQGGAGGFYNGMKTAYESEENFDGVWVMDDDGLPDACQLERLLEYFPEYDYLAPLVLSVDNPSKLAFNYHGLFSPETLKAQFKDIIDNYACPFNGILYSRTLISKIGFPIPQLFIWGDERNYDQRAKDQGFIPHTVLSAIHYHPEDKMKVGKSIFGKSVILVPNKWKGYCNWRNTIFNAKGHFAFRQYISYYLYNSYYLLFIKKSWSWFVCFNRAYFSGFKRIPDDGYKKYMKNNT